MQPLKSINYRGGIVKFEVPTSWMEEYEPLGGATFYEDQPDSGTLRLNVLSLGSNGTMSGEAMVADLIARSGYTALHDGLAIRKYVKECNEAGEQLQMTYWEVAIPVEASSVRLAIFSFTILNSQAADPQMQEQMELLARSILSAEYSRAQGEAGEHMDE